MSFSANITGHIHGEAEEAKAFEQELVTDLRAIVARIEESGHSVGATFHGQHTGSVELHTEPTGDTPQAAPTAGQPAVEPDGAPTGQTMDPTANPTNADPAEPVAITSEGIKPLAESNEADLGPGEPPAPVAPAAP